MRTLDLIKTIDPDIVLMDIVMPRLSGVEAVGRISKEFPRTKAIVVSMHASEEYVRPALRAGAAGYLMKDAAAAELALAIQTVMQGKTYLSPPISELGDQELFRSHGEQPEIALKNSLRASAKSCK